MAPTGGQRSCHLQGDLARVRAATMGPDAPPRKEEGLQQKVAGGPVSWLLLVVLRALEAWPVNGSPRPLLKGL